MNKTGFGWRAVRNRHNAWVRALPTAQTLPRLLRTHKPATVRTPRTRRTITAREAAVVRWYFYGGLEDVPPEGLTDEELMIIRERWCK